MCVPGISDAPGKRGLRKEGGPRLALGYQVHEDTLKYKQRKFSSKAKQREDGKTAQAWVQALLRTAGTMSAPMSGAFLIKE